MRKYIFLVIDICMLGFVLSGCQPAIQSPSPTPTEKTTNIPPTKTATVTPSPTFAPTPTTTLPLRPTTTPSLTPTATLVIGPDVNLYYLSDGAIYRLNLQTWAKDRITFSHISKVSLSPDRRFIAFQNKNGLFISDWPSLRTSTQIPSVGDPGNFIFNNRYLLAFSDDEGLKIYNPNTNEIKTLKYQNTDVPNEEVAQFRYYYPVSWSPDGIWLWITVGGWESYDFLLTNIITGAYYEYTGCYEDISWSADSSLFTTSVIWSGYAGCGSNNGVFVVSVSGNNLTEKQVYTIRENYREHEYYFATPNPPGNRIIFTLTDYIRGEFKNDIRHSLLLYDFASNAVQELEHNNDEIVTPKWSEDGNAIYYVIRNDVESRIIRLDLRTFEKITTSYPIGNLELIQIISSSDWLVARTVSMNYYDPHVLMLINSSSGQTATLLSHFYPDSEYNSFLGIDPIQ